MFKKNGKTTTLGVTTPPKDKNKQASEAKSTKDNIKPQDKNQK